MFEELCRSQGKLLIPNGKYEDSCPQYEEIPVTYFSMDKTFRTEGGAFQINTQYYCKGYDKAAPAGSKLILEDGSEIESETIEFLFNHFDNNPEFNVITAVAK